MKIAIIKSYIHKREGILLFSFVLILKIILLFIFAYEGNGNFNEKLIYTGDSGNYLDYAQYLYDGKIENSPKRTPLYPLFIYTSHLFFGKNNPWYILLVQQVLYALTVLVFYNICRIFFKKEWLRWIAVSLFISDPIFFIFSFRYSNENLAILFNLSMVLFLFKYIVSDTNKNRYIILSGIFAGLSILSRPIYLLIPVFFSLMIFISTFKNDGLIQKIFAPFKFLAASYSLVALWAVANMLIWNTFSISGNESVKVRTTFAYHYSNYANNKPVYWDQFEAFKDSLFKSYQNQKGHFPDLDEQNQILSDYSNRMFKEYWYVYLYLPLKYSYKFFQPGTLLYYSYTGQDEPNEHISTTRLSEFQQKGFFATLWDKLDRGPGIFIYGLFNICLVFFIITGFLIGIFYSIKLKEHFYFSILSAVIFIYTAYLCGSMIQARYRVVFFWMFILISIYGWNKFYNFLMVKLGKHISGVIN